MNMRNDIRVESDLLEELRFGPSRGAPTGAALRVEERLRRTLIAELGEMDRLERVLPPEPRTLRRFRGLSVGPASFFGGISLAILLTGVVWAAVQTMNAHRRLARVETVDRAAAPARDERPVASAPSAAADDDPVAVLPQSPAPSGASTAIPSSRNDQRTIGPSSDLIAERALLDPARGAFGHGEYADAEQMLDTHAHRFPAGFLAEEREALIVKTLAAEGRLEEARSRATRFHAHFPRSLFGTAVDNALRVIP